MYRNTYLEMYKNASAADASITLMFAHFTQIYNTLGCVLQDLEYQMGKVLAQQPVLFKEKGEESYQQYHRPKQKMKDKQVIKIQEPEVQAADKTAKIAKEFEGHRQELKQRITQPIKKKIQPQLEQTEARMKAWNIEAKKVNPRDSTEERVQHHPVQVPRKTLAKPCPTDSFESFFEPKKTNRTDMIQKQPQNSRLGQIPPLRTESSNPVVENTYDDFLDRFFKDEKNRRSS